MTSCTTDIPNDVDFTSRCNQKRIIFSWNEWKTFTPQKSYSKWILFRESLCTRRASFLCVQKYNFPVLLRHSPVVRAYQPSTESWAAIRIAFRQQNSCDANETKTKMKMDLKTCCYYKLGEYIFMYWSCKHITNKRIFLAPSYRKHAEILRNKSVCLAENGWNILCSCIA